MAQQFWATATSGVEIPYRRHADRLVLLPIYCLDGKRVAQALSAQACAGAVFAGSLRAAVCCRMAEITATSVSTADGGAVLDAAAPRFGCAVVGPVRASDGVLAGEGACAGVRVVA